MVAFYASTTDEEVKATLIRSCVLAAAAAVSTAVRNFFAKNVSCQVSAVVAYASMVVGDFFARIVSC